MAILLINVPFKIYLFVYYNGITNYILIIYELSTRNKPDAVVVIEPIHANSLAHYPLTWALIPFKTKLSFIRKIDFLLAKSTSLCSFPLDPTGKRKQSGWSGDFTS